jgi:hypothetical protein
MDLHASLTLKFAPGITASSDADFFWRHSLGEGSYDIPGNLMVSGKTADERYAGAHANVGVAWQATRHLSLRRVPEGGRTRPPSRLHRDIGDVRILRFERENETN